MRKTLSNFLAGELLKQEESTQQIGKCAFISEFMGNTIALAHNARYNLRPLCMKQVEQVNFKSK